MPGADTTIFALASAPGRAGIAVIRLSGPGAVVVKGVALSQDYRYDIPAIGPTTVDAMAEGGVTALAVEAGRVLLVDREDLVRRADAAGIAVVGIDEP